METDSKLVLYADDDLDDINWVKEACRSLNAKLIIEFVENGKQVFSYLISHQLEDLPHLIVLDLNMPEMDGRQTLQKIKEDENFMHIPVAIVTTSSNEIDKKICYRLGAAFFLTKPESQVQWQEILVKFQTFLDTD